jgi:peptidoglycan/LPS O-acetylase OafA/YrhL
MTAKPHYGAIDLLRLMAAVAVMLFHYIALSPAAGHTSQSYPELYPVAKYGALGVNLFFIISGFVVALSAHGRTASTFLAARAKRLYPAFWAACMLTAVVILPWSLKSLGQLIGNMTLFAPYLGQASIDGVYWSLYAEIRFYLYVAVILAIGQERNFMIFMTMWLAVSAVNLLFTIPRGLGLFVLEYCPLFVAGTVYSEIARKSEKPWHYGLLAIAIVLSIVYAGSHPSGVVAKNFMVEALLLLVFHGTIWMIATQRLRVPKWPVLPLIGGLSYPLYLVHGEIGNVLINSIAANRFLVLISTSVVSIFLAWLIHVLIEQRRRPHSVKSFFEFKAPQ